MQKYILSLLIFYILFKSNRITAFEHYGNCSSPTGFEGYCVELTRCKSLYGFLTKPNLKENEISHLRLSRCGFINQFILVCCTGKVMEAINSGVSNVFPDNSIVAQQSNPSISLPVRTDMPKVNARSAVVLPRPPQCGTQRSSRISVGGETSIYDFPWLALLQYTTENNEKEFKAEGSLINEFYVLTAAHSLNSASGRLTAVRLGEWNISASPDCVNGQCAPPHIDIAVDKLIPHPEFSVRKRTADIGLVRLAQRVAFTHFVKPICLPIAPVFRSTKLSTNSLAYLAGWGESADHDKRVVKVKTNLRIYDQEDCANQYAQLTTNITANQICAGSITEGQPCAGNGGAGLVVEQRAMVLVGVTSFGVAGCGDGSLPSVFTRVDAYLDWIQATMEP